MQRFPVFLEIFSFLPLKLWIFFLNILIILFIHFFYNLFNIFFLRMILVEDKTTEATFMTRACHWTVRMWMDKIFISSWWVHHVMGSP